MISRLLLFTCALGLLCVLAIVSLYFPRNMRATPLFAQVNPMQLTPEQREVKRLQKEGREAFDKDELTQAKAIWLQAVKKAQAIDYKRGMADLYNDLKHCCYYMSDYNEMIAYSRLAVELYETLGDHSGVADNLNALGVAYMEQRQWTKALQYHTRALEKRKTMKDQKAVGESLNNIGRVYIAQSNYKDALNCFTKAMEIPAYRQNSKLVADTGTNIGISYLELGFFTRAKTMFADALGVYKSLGNEEDIADAYNHLGMAYNDPRDNEQALENYNKALAGHERINQRIDNRRNIARILNNIGVLHDSEGKYYIASELYTKAIDYYKALNDLTRRARTLSNRGASYHLMRRNDAALADLTEALVIQRELGNSMDIFRTLKHLGAVYLDTKQFEKARSVLAESEKLLLRLQSQVPHPLDIGAFQQARQGNLYAIEAMLLLQLDQRADLALEKAEQGRAWGLRLQAVQNRVLLPDILKEKIDFPRLQTLSNQHPDTLFLEFAIVNKQKTLAFALSSGKASAQLLSVGEAYLTEKAKGWRDEIERFSPDINKGDQKKEENAAKELYNAILAPLEKAKILPADDTGNIKRLVIVADGPLLTIPFAAMLDGKGRRLMPDRFALSTDVSLATLTWRSNQRKPKSGLLAVAVPTVLDEEILRDGLMAGDKLRPIEFICKEIERLAKAYPGVKPLYGKEGSKGSVKNQMPGAQRIVFGTHGYSNGFLSRLLLADGFLEWNDIALMPLTAQLVELWACESGLGERSGGEGLLGLAWAFRAAGVPAIIASQWKVSDAATARLIRAFHAELRKPKTRKDDALRESMRALRQQSEYNFAYYWAAFQVIGDTQPIPHN